MRVLKFFLSLVAVVVVHVVGVRLHPQFSVLVDAFLVFAILHSLEANEASSQVGGAVIGLTHDAFTGGAFGLFGVATTVVSYLVALGSRRLVIKDPLPVALVFLVGSAIYQAIALGLASFFLGSVPTFPQTVLQAIATGILGLLAFLARRGSRRQWASWRQNRSRRLS